MADAPLIADIKTESDTWTVERLVEGVTSGTFRIPFLQRDLAWKSDDVIALFDSVYRGYPIGSLLLRGAGAEAATVELGPLTINAGETENALWVVDGQQRLVSLAASLARRSPIPTTPEDPYVVYFDPRERTFRPPSARGGVPSVWVPLPELADSAQLGEWIITWDHFGDVDLRRTVFDAGRRLREYKVPLYIVRTDDLEVLKTVFLRTNNYGKSLDWPEVYHAMFGEEGEDPSTPAQLASTLAGLGMGRPNENLLLQCVLACQGLDVTQPLSTYIDSHAAELRHGVADAEPAVRRALAFLRDRCAMPHLALVPRPTPALIILSAFLRTHPSPNPRTQQLLARWVWRMSFGFDMDQRTLLRNGIAAAGEKDQERAVGQLLDLHPREAPEYTAPDAYSSTAADSRLAMLGLVSLGPRDLKTHRPLDVAALIERAESNPFPRIWRRRGNPLADRAVAPGDEMVLDRLLALAKSAETVVLRSHAIDDEGRTALLVRDPNTFLRRRRRRIEVAVRGLGARLAAWGHNDRPSIGALIERVS